MPLELKSPPIPTISQPVQLFLGGSAAGVRVAFCKVIQSKGEISAVREEYDRLANNQREVAYVYELSQYDENSRISDAHAGKRQVTRRLGLVNASYLKKNINVQGDVGQEGEQV
jgi:hypothetical protein